MSTGLIQLGDGGAVCQGGQCELPIPGQSGYIMPDLPKLTLISFPTCPYVQRAVIALKERGVSFDVIYIDLADKPDWFQEISPLGKVPVLKVEVKGKETAYLFESTAILQYLDETLPGVRLYPEDALARAQQRAWIEYASHVLADLYRLAQAPNRAMLDEAVAAVKSRLAPLEAEVTGPYFAGTGFSAVDVVYAPAFRQIDVIEAVKPLRLIDDLPRLNAWRMALADRPSVRDAVPADFGQRFLDRLRRANAFIIQQEEKPQP